MRLLLPSVTFAQGTAPSPAAVAEVERVIVTGSNIPTAEEIGSQSSGYVSSGRPRKTGHPQCNGPADQSAAGDGHDRQPERFRWRRWQRHTEPAGFAAERNSGSHRWKTRCHSWDWRCFQCRRPTSAGVDINLIPFPMIDHIDILKDGASAVYGSRRGSWRDQHLFDTQVPWS